jgi:phage terminase small subunit
MKRVGTDGLNDLQRAFVTEYLVDKNATAAYIRAGYKAKGTSAGVRASTLLDNVKVRAAIDKKLTAILERVEITPERILQELAAIAFADTTDFVQIVEVESYKRAANGDYELDEDFKRIPQNYEMVTLKPTDQLTKFQRKAIKTIKQGKEGIEITLHDKKGALELLGRNAKLFVDKTELSGPDGEQLQVVFNIPRPPKKE